MVAHTYPEGVGRRHEAGAVGTDLEVLASGDV